MKLILYRYEMRLVLAKGEMWFCDLMGKHRNLCCCRGQRGGSNFVNKGLHWAQDTPQSISSIVALVTASSGRRWWRKCLCEKRDTNRVGGIQEKTSWLRWGFFFCLSKHAGPWIHQNQGFCFAKCCWQFYLSEACHYSDLKMNILSNTAVLNHKYHSK